MNVVPALTTTNDTVKKNYCSELLKFSFELRLEGEKEEKRDPPSNHFVWLLCSTVCIQQNLGCPERQPFIRQKPNPNPSLKYSRGRNWISYGCAPEKEKSELSSDAFKASSEPPF